MHIYLSACLPPYLPAYLPAYLSIYTCCQKRLDLLYTMRTGSSENSEAESKSGTETAFSRRPTEGLQSVVNRLTRED